MSNKKDEDVYLKNYIIQILRRASVRWKPRNKAKAKAKITVQEGFYKNGNPKMRVYYVCQECGQLCKDNRKAKVRLELDHKVPVINPEGWDGWENLHRRLFVGEADYTPLCNECHRDKTTEENKKRK